MKTVHLVCNAHLDPVWLWTWEEGCTEALSTFRTAAELTEEFPGMVFNHNEALLYEWVKNNDPALFETIRAQIKEGKWHIMGGWYLQPDCNMPSGESLVRNILLGRRFFEKEFGVRPTTAINFDSFGHSQGLVQVLNQAGYNSYVVCRPHKSVFEFPEQDFIWRGLDGSEILVHRSDENYNSVLGHAAEELEAFLKENEKEEISLFLWGVGDHGGGPSRQDLRNLEKFFEEHKDNVRLLHSTPEDWFAELPEAKRPVVDRGLNPVAEGCYTSQIRVKQKHRRLENELYSGEKMLSAAAIHCGLPYPKETLGEAQRDLVFSEFHDALPGSGTQRVEEDTLRLLDHGLEILSRERMKAFLALSAGQPPVEDGCSNVLVYNPHPWPITDILDFEVGLPKQNWDSTFYYPQVYQDGVLAPTQSEMESSHFCIDWRKRVVTKVHLPASAMTTLSVRFEPLPKRPTYAPIAGEKKFVFDNGEMKVEINTATGLIDCYQVGEATYLNQDSMALTIRDDTCNPWGFGDPDRHSVYRMNLLTPHEASAFSGLSDMVCPAVRIIDDGPVRTVVEALFGWHDSYAYQRYLLPKKGTCFDVEMGVYWNEKDRSLKLELNTEFSDGEFWGQIAFGREKLYQDGQEVVAQKWVSLGKNDCTIAVFNDGIHGFCEDRGTIGMTLLRSPGYSAADGNFEKTLREVRHTVRMEQGERLYRFRVWGGKTAEISHRLDAAAQVFNERPYALAFNPSGKGTVPPAGLRLDNEAVILSCFKKAEDDTGYVFRLYESTGSRQNVTVSFGDRSTRIEMGPFEIKTFLLSEKASGITEVNILEGTVSR